jgi:hypothetical protein
MVETEQQKNAQQKNVATHAHNKRTEITPYIFAVMYLMGAKLGYFHRILFFRGGGGGAILLTVKSDVVCQILWASTSWAM